MCTYTNHKEITIKLTYAVMKKQLLSMILIVASGLAIAHAESTTSDALEKERARGLVYRVSTNNHSVVLYGSLHAGMSEADAFSEYSLRHAKGSTILNVEADVRKSAILDSLLLRYAYRETDGSGYMALGKATIRSIMSRLRPLGINEDQLIVMRPWYVATILPVARVPGDETVSSKHSVDARFLSSPLIQSIPVREIESLELQIQLLSEGTDKDEYNRLQDWVGMIESGFANDYQKCILYSWRARSLSDMSICLDRLKKINNSYSIHYIDKVIIGRNYIFANAIQDALTDKKTRNTFIIGSEHFGGPEGIVAILEKRGLHVEQLD